MATNKKQQLKNKFIGVEMSLEDGELKYILPVESLQPVQKQNKNELPYLFLYVGYLVRILKISFIFFGKYCRKILSRTIKPIFQEIIKTALFSIAKIKNIQEQCEITLEDYLSKVEINQLFERENSKIIEESRDDYLRNYKKELEQVCSGVSVDVELICEKNELEKVNLSLAFDIALYESVFLKLSEGNMLANISHLSIKSVVTEKKVINEMVFVLKVAGEKWSKIFSKYIASELLRKIEGHDGSVKNIHFVNSTKKVETFNFVFSHRRLDFFMDKVIVESLPKKSVKLSPNHGRDLT